MKRKHIKFYTLMLAALLTMVSIIAPIYATGDTTAETVGYSTARVRYVDTKPMTDLKTVADATELTETAYKITDVAGFKALDALVVKGVSFAGKTVYLANDVDFTGVSNFNPIGWIPSDAINDQPTKAFNGTFDGQGNMVNNLVVNIEASNKENAADYGGFAMFAAVTDATIKNFIVGPECSFIYNADAHDHGCLAGFVMCSFRAVFDNCMNMADMINSSRFTGGIVAREYENTTIINCTNTGDLYGCQSVGGMVAVAQPPSAGMPVEVSTCDITNSRNTGTCMVMKGYAENGSGMVGSNHNVGAMVGWAQNSVAVVGSINNGMIMGIDNVGGFVGEITSWGGISPQISFKDCSDFGVSMLIDRKSEASNTCGDETLCATGTPVSEENSTIRRGADKPTEDPSCIIEEIVPDYTPDSANPGAVVTPPDETEETQATTEATQATTEATQATTEATQATTEATQATTEATQATTAVSTTAEPTSAPTSASTTKAPTTEAPADDAAEGCQSTVIGGIAVILLVSGAALTLTKKKED
ncbi:MAG: hypothetical protein IKC31_00020 [Clostridia bacterium]|nr:hypothetical protein [Clostridia bacterium]